MVKIKSKIEYNATMERIEDLLKVVSNDTPGNDKNLIELALLSDLVADYEDEHFPVSKPSLIDVIKLRMYEMNLTQKSLAEMLGVSPSRISEIISGKSEPTLSIARNLCVKLDISASIVLGV